MMMTKTIIAAVIICAASALAAHADSAQVMHAGEWETRIGEGMVRRTCLNADRAFDPATLIKLTAKAGAKCTLGDAHADGPTITYVATCEIGGGHMTLHSTITSGGPDSFTSRSKAHYECGPIKIPDMDMTQTSHRLGSCQPGDAKSPF
jgi:Protein of unknown function (DUF3617)